MSIKFSPEDIRSVGKLLKRKRQIVNWKCEIDDKIATLQRQKTKADEELAEIEAQLQGDFAELVEAAAEFASITGQSEQQERLAIHNPNYVTNQDKEKLLAEILSQFQAENPQAKTMTFQQVKAVLAVRYGIETRTIGNFFRRQLPAYEARGGNKKKVIVLPKKSPK